MPLGPDNDPVFEVLRHAYVDLEREGTMRNPTFIAVCACGYRTRPHGSAGLAHADLDWHVEHPAPTSTEEDALGESF